MDVGEEGGDYCYTNEGGKGERRKEFKRRGSNGVRKRGFGGGGYVDGLVLWWQRDFICFGYLFLICEGDGGACSAGGESSSSSDKNNYTSKY